MQPSSGPSGAWGIPSPSSLWARSSSFLDLRFHHVWGCPWNSAWPSCLFLLGVLNLTGVMQKMTSYFTPELATPSGTAASAPQEKSASRMEKLLENTVGRIGLFQCLRPLAIGLVHGLAGSAAVALLVLSTIHNPIWATVYLLIFGAGTMIGMMCMTAAIAVPLTFAGERFTKLGSGLAPPRGWRVFVSARSWFINSDFSEDSLPAILNGLRDSAARALGHFYPWCEWLRKCRQDPRTPGYSVAQKKGRMRMGTGPSKESQLGAMADYPT